MILWDDATNLGYTEVCIHVKTRNNTISDHATGWRQNVFMLISIQQFFLSPCNTSHVHNRINSIKKANSFQVTLHYDFFDIYNKSKKISLCNMAVCCILNYSLDDLLNLAGGNGERNSYTQNKRTNHSISGVLHMFVWTNKTNTSYWQQGSLLTEICYR